MRCEGAGGCYVEGSCAFGVRIAFVGESVCGALGVSFDDLSMEDLTMYYDLRS